MYPYTLWESLSVRIARTGPAGCLDLNLLRPFLVRDFLSVPGVSEGHDIRTGSVPRSEAEPFHLVDTGDVNSIRGNTDTQVAFPEIWTTHEFLLKILNDASGHEYC